MGVFRRQGALNSAILVKIIVRAKKLCGTVVASHSFTIFLWATLAFPLK
jgi:predicted DNA-binding protein (UPF0278 family)